MDAAEEGVDALMTYSQVSVEHDTASFEQKRVQVFEIIESALDPWGADFGLLWLVDRLHAATEEDEFDATFKELLDAMSQAT